jgi:hypothetical protein
LYCLEQNGLGQGFYAKWYKILSRSDEADRAHTIPKAR